MFILNENTSSWFLFTFNNTTQEREEYQKRRDLKGKLAKQKSSNCYEETQAICISGSLSQLPQP